MKSVLLALAVIGALATPILCGIVSPNRLEWVFDDPALWIRSQEVADCRRPAPFGELSIADGSGNLVDLLREDARSCCDVVESELGQTELHSSTIENVESEEFPRDWRYRVGRRIGWEDESPIASACEGMERILRANASHSPTCAPFEVLGQKRPELKAAHRLVAGVIESSREMAVQDENERALRFLFDALWLARDLRSGRATLEWRLVAEHATASLAATVHAVLDNVALGGVDLEPFVEEAFALVDGWPLSQVYVGEAELRATTARQGYERVQLLAMREFHKSIIEQLDADDERLALRQIALLASTGPEREALVPFIPALYYGDLSDEYTASVERIQDIRWEFVTFFEHVVRDRFVQKAFAASMAQRALNDCNARHELIAEFGLRAEVDEDQLVMTLHAPVDSVLPQSLEDEVGEQRPLLQFACRVYPRSRHGFPGRRYRHVMPIPIRQ